MFLEVSYIRSSKTKYLQQHLHKFLVLYHKLDIPQVGSFTIDAEPARLEPASGLLFPPRPVIHFDETAKPAPERIFFNYLAEETGSDELSVIREYHEFCYRFREDINRNGMAVLPGVGRIVKRDEGQLTFTPESTLLELLPPVPWSDHIAAAQKKVAKVVPPAEPRHTPKQPEIVITEPEHPADKPAPTAVTTLIDSETELFVEEEMSEEAEASPDRWWIYALILLVAGILAILYDYR